MWFFFGFHFNYYEHEQAYRGKIYYELLKEKQNGKGKERDMIAYLNAPE